MLLRIKNCNATREFEKKENSNKERNTMVLTRNSSLYILMLLRTFVLSIGVIQTTFITQQWNYPRHSTISLLSPRTIENPNATLRFGASYTYTSSPILIQSQNSTEISLSLHDFFKSKEHRDFLLIGSGNMKVMKKESSPRNICTTRLNALWEKEASFFTKSGIEESNEDVERVDLLIETSFLVFVLNASAILGVKLTKDGECEEVFTDGKVHSPEFQFLLLTENFAADGPPPLVWIFDQLTGRYREKSSLVDKTNDSHIIHTFLRVWASDSKSIQGDIRADRIVFKACCRAEVEINFPPVLLQILPVAKEIIEKEGNVALKRSMERDIVPGVNKFRDAYILWERKKRY